MNDRFAEIELAEAVAAIRRQLATAAEQAADERLQFEVGPVELEFSVEVRRDATAGGKVRAWVLSAEAGASAGRTATHRVSLTLTPRDVGSGGSVLIGHQDLGAREDFH
ncbi:trypco2 family protein [Kitasatospora sp. NPDC058965]|uniref:trypco2 family protein n=1 Tax=Kitasatospora sp. NPDC058965 TaxID=3346682 RepID=UPI00369951ED